MIQHEIATISKTGHIIIPQMMRKDAGIETDTRVILVRKGKTIVIKPQVPNVKKKLNNIFKKMDKKKINISDKIILEEIKKYRKTK